MFLSISKWLFLTIIVFFMVCALLHARIRSWPSLEPFMFLLCYCALFWSESGHKISLFSHSSKTAAVTVFFLSLQLILFFTVAGPTRKKSLALIAFIPFLSLTALLALLSYNALSVSSGGGLIQPTLFRFDFSQYLSLQNEIKLNDNLVLIAHVPEEYSRQFIRRTWLGGWNAKKGFYEQDPPRAERQRQHLPRGPEQIDHVSFELRQPVTQEYFIVNFDPKALVAMDYPTYVTPFRLWDKSSFNGAFSVQSEVSGFMPFELYDCPPPTGDPAEGLTEDGLRFYTYIDNDTRAFVSPLAEVVVSRIPGYLDRINALTMFLHDGEYRYSLKPGKAQDGNQLRHFLYDSKKGYCTYFAFSLCLMLRSQGIPSRIAAGFFMQPDAGTLDYYPVRANMAHAWVEVFFPRYGWIAFDPTTTNLAEGELITFGSGSEREEFHTLLGEIFDKRSSLVAEIEQDQDQEARSILATLRHALRQAARAWGLAFLLFTSSIVILALIVRNKLILRFSRNPRSVILAAETIMFNALGMRKILRDPLLRHAATRSLTNQEAIALAELARKARFSPHCDNADMALARSLLSSFLKNHRNVRKRKIKTQTHSFLLIASLTALSVLAPDAYAQNAPFPSEEDKEAYISRALMSINAENWESAITLLSEGAIMDPAEPRFPFHLGSVFLEQGLYAQARKELDKALKLGMLDPALYSRLSEASSYLNDDEAALLHQKAYLELVPDDPAGWSNYGWLCYKTKRLEEGISSMLTALNRYGPEGSLYVSLGNLYTAAFDYSNARRYYTLAIEFAKERNQAYHLAVYYYNRSILEEVFYHFQEAEDDTKRSLEASPRSSGYLMRGELSLRKQDFREAFAWYQKAQEKGEAPLALLGSAETALQAGFPDLALESVDQALEKQDLSWISNFGTTTDQFLSDIHRIRRDAFLQKRSDSHYTVVHNFSTFFKRLFQSATYRLLSWYHNGLYRIYTSRVARHYELSEAHAETLMGNGLFTNSYYFLAFDQWPTISRPYLLKARGIEETHVPASRPSYLYETGRLSRDPQALQDAISSLDALWERDYLVKALTELYRLAQDPQAAALLLSIQPSSFRLHGLTLPVRVSVDVSPNHSWFAKMLTRRIMYRALTSTGFKVSTVSDLELSINETQDEIQIVLQDRNKSITYFAQVFHKRHSLKKDLAYALTTLRAIVFSSLLE